MTYRFKCPNCGDICILTSRWDEKEHGTPVCVVCPGVKMELTSIPVRPTGG